MVGLKVDVSGCRPVESWVNVKVERKGAQLEVMTELHLVREKDIYSAKQKVVTTARTMDYCLGFESAVCSDMVLAV